MDDTSMSIRQCLKRLSPLPSRCDPYGSIFVLLVGIVGGALTCSGKSIGVYIYGLSGSLAT